MRAEIEIRGAGPVGCVLALALSRSARPVVLVENQRVSNSFRPVALSHASRLILERVGVWETLAPTAIDQIHVSQQGAFGRVRLTAAEAGVPALGYVADYASLLEHLLARVEACRTRKESEPGEARLVVHAEGFSEDAKEERYPHDALVALIDADPRAGGTAWERFTPEGPLALLPLAGRYGLVWGMNPERARTLTHAPVGEFLAALQEGFGGRAGQFTGDRKSVV